jgi:asparagine synthase (glutamine-hydrolysing)
MCGIAGLFGPGSPTDNMTLREAASAMNDAVAHRGPDGSGLWVDEEAGVALAHRRLSILDLTDHAAQPMRSASERFVLTYNGEVYNFRALRTELEALGHRFRGAGDTEVMLAAIEQWGAFDAVRRFVGMFAFAVWDRRERTLTLARDRLGIKPLYVGRRGGRVAFGSELRALERAPGPPPRIDREVLGLFFRYACVPGGHSLFEGIESVGPGEVWTYRDPGEAPARTTFWSAREVAASGLARPTHLDEASTTERVEDTVRRAVVDRMVADVPLGVFLSGGIDSSLVAALMQAESTRPIRTFSIGFADERYDEAPYARAIARHLGTDHTELVVTADEALAAVPRLGAVYDEPFADSSQLPTLLVCTLARQHVTVALSGDGGDEVFGGYNRHLWGPRVWRVLEAVPPPARAAAAALLRSPSPATWDAFAARSSALMPLLRLRTPGDKAHKLAGLLGARDFDELYLRLTSIWPAPEELVLGARGSHRRFETLTHASPTEQLLYRDLVSYLPDDILTKVDRASMSVGLEVRVPLLDHRVVELAWRLPISHKVAGGVGKRVLRRVLGRHVPEALFERPKMGFGVPLDAWLRGPLRDWAESLIDPHRLRREGFLDPARVRACWDDLLAERGVAQHRLWSILMFQSWLDAPARSLA